jgi:hypothetical protein
VRRIGVIIVGKEPAVGIASLKRSLPRLRTPLRTIAVVVAMPLILLVILCATLLRPVEAVRSRLHSALRLWMSVLDWMHGIPIGYTYWVQYQAPVMLDEIAVHHDE